MIVAVVRLRSGTELFVDMPVIPEKPHTPGEDFTVKLSGYLRTGNFFMVEDIGPPRPCTCCSWRRGPKRRQMLNPLAVDSVREIEGNWEDD